MHLSLLSATSAPQKRKVNMYLSKKLSLCVLLEFILNIIGNIRNFMKKYIIQPVNRFFSAGNPLQLIETFGSFVTQQQSGEGSHYCC